MFKLLTYSTIAALSAVAIPATAAAQDAAPCGEGYAPVESMGGPLCVNPIYLDGTWNDHPSECEHGYFQGSCAPALAPVVLPPEAYTFQTETPAPAEPTTPVHAATAIVAPVTTLWLSALELHLGDLRGAR